MTFSGVKKRMKGQLFGLIIIFTGQAGEEKDPSHCVLSPQSLRGDALREIEMR